MKAWNEIPIDEGPPGEFHGAAPPDPVTEITAAVTLEDIQRAHDLIEAWLDGQLPLARQPDRRTLERLAFSHITLCWILGHANGQNFTDLLNALSAAAETAGYRLRFVPGTEGIVGGEIPGAKTP